MVVVCESCSTRFRIDDARIPAKGRLVRCSQCKATFIAKPENASFEDTVQEVVAEVTDSGGSPTPEPAADLFDTVGEDLGGETQTRTSAPSDDERWEFDEEPRKPAPELPIVERSEPTVATEAASSSLDDIGNPAEWDLLRGAPVPAAREAQFIEPVEPARSPEPEPAAAAEPEPFLRPLADEPEPAPEPEAKPKKAKKKREKKEKKPRKERTQAPAREPRESSGRGAAVGRSLAQSARVALALAAWAALAGIVYVGVTPLLAVSATSAAARPAAPRTVGLADGEARGIDARFVENAFAAPLFVVRGELARPNADRRLGLRVRFVDAHGAPLGDAVWAGASRSAQELRESAPATLRSELDASAAQAALGGPFVAVFETIPPEAQGFALALEPLPGPPPDFVGPPLPDATASSPPSPRPSSE